MNKLNYNEGKVKIGKWRKRSYFGQVYVGLGDGVRGRNFFKIKF